MYGLRVYGKVDPVEPPNRDLSATVRRKPRCGFGDVADQSFQRVTIDVMCWSILKMADRFTTRTDVRHGFDADFKMQVDPVLSDGGVRCLRFDSLGSGRNVRY